MSQLRWMLDTNILSDLIRNPQAACAQRLASEPPGAVCTSVFVACEMRFGVLRKASKNLIERVEAVLSRTPVLPFEDEASAHYADIRLSLERAGTPIGSHDLLIAAQTRSLGLTLVSNNLREFERVPGLRIEDWLTPQVPRLALARQTRQAAVPPKRLKAPPSSRRPRK